MIVIETRRSKGIHKADLTKFTKEEVKEALDWFKSSSYVAVKNYRTDAMEIKFHLLRERGQVKYCLKTNLTDEDFKALKFAKTEKGNWHLTKSGCTIDSLYDVEVKEPVKKIESKKTKAEKKAKEEAKTVDSAKKKPLPAPTSKASTTAKAEEAETVKASK